MLPLRVSLREVSAKPGGKRRNKTQEPDDGREHATQKRLATQNGCGAFSGLLGRRSHSLDGIAGGGAVVNLQCWTFHAEHLVCYLRDVSALRIVGIILAALGVIAAAYPGWFEPLTGGPEPAADTFEAIERRVRGGMVLGIGLMFIARTELRPWHMTVASLLFYFMLGALLARVLGLVVEGIDARQWSLVAIETAVMTLAALWMWRGARS